MKHTVVVLLITMILVACSAPASLVGQPGAEIEQAPPSYAPTESAPTVSGTAGSGPPSEEQTEQPPWGIGQQHPSDVDNSTLPITAVEDLHSTGRPQEYDINTYRLVVDGLVQNSLSLSYKDILARPQVTELVLLTCPGFFWDNAEWTGTPLSLILEEAGPLPDAAEVRFVSGSYSITLSLEEATADGVFLAYEVNGETLPVEHGYPLRLVARHQYGSKWVKWVEHIEVIA